MFILRLFPLIVTDLRESQSKKAPDPIDFTLLGIVRLVIESQSLNAFDCISVTVYPPSVEGIVTLPLIDVFAFVIIA